MLAGMALQPLSFGTNLVYAIQAAPGEKVKVFDKDKWFDNLSSAAVNEQNSKLYVVDIMSSASSNGTASGSIIVLNSSTFDRISTIPEDYYPSDIVLNPVTGYFYVSHSCNCPQGKGLTVLDGSNDKKIKTIENIAGMTIFVNPLLNKIYAANSSAVTIIDGNSNQILATRSLEKSGDQERLLAFNPANNIIYGMDQNFALASWDIETGANLYTTSALNIPLPDGALGNKVVHLNANPKTNIVYVMTMPIFPPPGPTQGAPIPSYYATAINGTSGKILAANLASGGGFWSSLVVNSERNIVFLYHGNSFEAIDGSTNQVVGQYFVDIGTNNIYFRKMIIHPETNTLYLIAVNGIAFVPGSSIVPEFPISLIVLFVALSGLTTVQLLRRASIGPLSDAL